MGEPWPRRWLTYQTNTDQSSDKEPHADSCDKEVTGSIPRPRLLTPRHLGPFSVDSACSSRVSCVGSPQVLHLPQHAHRYNWQSCKCRWLMVLLCGPAANWWLVTFALNQLVHSNDPLDSERRTTERLSKQECVAPKPLEISLQALNTCCGHLQNTSVMTGAKPADVHCSNQREFVKDFANSTKHPPWNPFM